MPAWFLKGVFILLSLGVFLWQTTSPSSTEQTKAHFSPQVIQQTLYVFGTVVNINIHFPATTSAKQQATNQQQATQAIQQIDTTFQAFHRQWHAWEPLGKLFQINQAIAHQQPIQVDNETKAFIQYAQKMCRQSNGFFDPGIGKLIALWSFHSEDWHGPPPTQKILNNWLRHPASILDIHFQGNQLSSSNPQVQLDFGGSAKGLALDKAIQILKDHHIQHAVVNIGGDMRVLGNKPADNNQQSIAWRIGIQSPKHADEVIAIAQLPHDMSIVTSGTYQRFFTWQGKQYSHLINPKTARPANTFSSVTVLNSNATLADSAATALLIAGPTHWKAVAKQLGITDFMLIEQSGKITLQSQFITLIHP